MIILNVQKCHLYERALNLLVRAIADKNLTSEIFVHYVTDKIKRRT